MKRLTKCNIGEIRPTQILYSYGVGSIVDLTNISAMIMGLDYWDTNHMERITEERLLAAVKSYLGNQVKDLMLPPSRDENYNPFDWDTVYGIRVSPFPRWYRCPKCNYLGPISSGLFELKTDPYNVDKIRYVHTTCRKAVKPPNVIPARFLVACEDGHLDDFPWSRFVHKWQDGCNGSLRIREVGISGTPRDIIVSCDGCGTSRTMADAFEEAAQPTGFMQCTGRHPHLRTSDTGGCAANQFMKPILTGASNSWFPITTSAISIPSKDSRLDQKIDENKALLKHATSFEILEAFYNAGNLKPFMEFSPKEIWAAWQKHLNQDEQTADESSSDLKLPEWQGLTDPKDNLTSDEFKLSEEEIPNGYEQYFEKIVLVERLKEVNALVGFTRIDSPSGFNEIGEIPEDKRAPLSRNQPTWVPVSIVRGEGIFFQFKEESIQQWLDNTDVRALNNRFFEAHCQWRRRRTIPQEELGYPGMRYVLLHSFSHAIMRQFCLECGYTSASLKERIYSINSNNPDEAMAGVLIYTSSPDSEGTLGGLVNLGRKANLQKHLDHGLENIRLCSSDPLCAEHLPSEEGENLHGSSCHSCIFAPETSCENGNKYLDRSVLIESVCNTTCSFFKNNE